MLSDLSGAEAVKVTALVMASQRSFELAVDGLDDWAMASSSALDGWRKAEVVAHVAYGAQAARRSTRAAVQGRHVPFYPGGDEQRRRTIERGRRAVPSDLRRELHNADTSLGASWRAMGATDWARPLKDPRFPRAVVARHLMLRWTEVEVHRGDLHPNVQDAWKHWSPQFVDVALPLRVAWQPIAHRNRDATTDIDATWTLAVPSRHWRWSITTSGDHARVSVAQEVARADVELSGSSGAMLAFLLGRASAANLSTSGDVDLAYRYKSAFPGP
jgi:maleylpyruvate isomerase